MTKTEIAERLRLLMEGGIGFYSVHSSDLNAAADQIDELEARQGKVITIIEMYEKGEITIGDNNTLTDVVEAILKDD